MSADRRSSSEGSPSSEERIRAAVDELRCLLSTIAGLAESNGHRAVQEIAMTARAGIARLDLICPAEPEPKEDGAPCEYFRAQDCLKGCPLIECQEAGACQKRDYGHGFGGTLESHG